MRNDLTVTVSEMYPRPLDHQRAAQAVTDMSLQERPARETTIPVPASPVSESDFTAPPRRGHARDAEAPTAERTAPALATAQAVGEVSTKNAAENAAQPSSQEEPAHGAGADHHAPAPADTQEPPAARGELEAEPPQPPAADSGGTGTPPKPPVQPPQGGAVAPPPDDRGDNSIHYPGNSYDSAAAQPAAVPVPGHETAVVPASAIPNRQDVPEANGQQPPHEPLSPEWPWQQPALESPPLYDTPKAAQGEPSSHDPMRMITDAISGDTKVENLTDWARNMTEVFAAFVRSFEAALDDPLIYPLVTERESSVMLLPPLLRSFFSSERERHRQMDEVDILHAGQAMINQTETITPEALLRAERKALDALYKLTANIMYIEKARIISADTNTMTGLERVLTMQALHKINSQPKPPAIVAFLRQSIPRFTWSGHALPSDVPVPADYREQLQQAWSGYTSQEAAMLINPEDLAAGQAPLHMAFNAAQAAEADGHTALGYQLKTAVVIEGLDMEWERFIGARPEIPYLQALLPGAIAGELGAAPKGAHFDYAAALLEVMNQTWEHVEQELGQGAPGPGVAFLHGLIERYALGTPHSRSSLFNLPPYLAVSLVRHANNGHVDLPVILKGLAEHGAPWAQELTRYVAEQPNRPLLTHDELADFARQAVPELGSMNVVTAAVQLAEDSDMYSFRLPLADVARVDSGVTAVVNVDIMPGVGEIQVTIQHRSRAEAHSIPMTIDMTTGELVLTAIDTDSIDAATATRYRSIVEKAITVETARNTSVIPEETALAAPTAAESRLVSPSLPQQQERTTPKVKTRGQADEEIAAAEAAVLPAAEAAQRVTLSGFNAEAIAKLLRKNKEKIEVDAPRLVQKVRYLADRANQTGVAFGKHTRLYGKLRMPPDNPIKLRQVNWVTGHRHQIRMYFREHSNGRLELCGVFHKTGEAEQHEYLQTLVDSLPRLQQLNPPPKGRGKRQR